MYHTDVNLCSEALTNSTLKLTQCSIWPASTAKLYILHCR